MPSHFLSCDWGTSHFRLRLVDQTTLTVLAEIHTEEGAASLSQRASAKDRPQRFAETLGQHILQLFTQTGRTAHACVISGMASSSIGWMELPYAVAPMPLEPEYLVRDNLALPVGAETVQVTLVSGVRTDEDVMRGEECELYGLLELHPEIQEARACVLLPGTHSKHIYLLGRHLEGFLTFMTGEAFAHLRQMPTLKALLAEGGVTSRPEFCEGVQTAARHGLLAGLFKIRARRLIEPFTEKHAHSFLSGLLVGTELLSLDFLQHPKVFLAGSPTLHPLYLLAAEQLGCPLLSIPPEILQQSLLHAHRSLLP